MKKEKIIIFALFGIYIILYLYLHLSNLGKGITVDEPIWSQRAINFSSAITSLNFRETYQSGHPGVITMYVSGLSHKIFMIFYKIFFPKLDLLIFNSWSLISLRLGIIFINTFCIYLIGILLLKRFKKPIWLATTLIFLGFEPFIVRFTRLVHVDGVVSLLITITILYFLLYLREMKKKDLVFSSIFLSMSLASKIPSLIFIPYAGLIIILFATNKLKYLKNLIISILISGLLLYVTWPVLWIDPIYALKDMALNSLIAIFRSHGAKSLTQGSIAAKNYFFYLETISYFIYPLLTGLFILSFFVSILKFIKKDFSELMTIASLQIFSLLFLAVLSIAGKQGDRYLLPTILLMALSGSYSVQTIFDLVKNKKIIKYGLYILTIIIFCFYLNNSFNAKKNYFITTNSWTPTNPRVLMLRTGLGEGLEEAAFYLNTKKKATKIKVGAWYDSSFSLYFKGKTYDIRNYKIDKPDYIVIYGNMYGRYKTHYASKIIEEFKSKKPEKIIYINNLPYVWIYKITKS